MTARSIARTSLGLLPLQSALRAVEAVLPLLLAAWFGRGALTDVYYFAWAVFSLAGSLVCSAFQDSAVVPILAEVKARDPASLGALRGALVVHTLAAAAAAAMLVGGGAAAWFAVHYAGTARTTALAMVVPFSLVLVSTAIKLLLASMLHAEHRYAPLPLASAAGAAVTIAVIASLRSSWSVVAIPCGTLAGEVVAVTWLAFAARAARLVVAPTMARPEPLRRLGKLLASEAGGSAVTRLNPVVDQLMAGFAGVAGGGTLLKLSGDLATVPTSLVQAALLPVLLSHLAEDFARGDIERLRGRVRHTLATVTGLLAGASVLLAALRRPLAHLLFAHGAMDADGVERLAALLPYHLVGLAPFGALLVLARAHVAMQNSRALLPAGAFNAAANALLDGVLLVPFGLSGLALATSGTSLVVALLLWARFEACVTASRAPARVAP